MKSEKLIAIAFVCFWAVLFVAIVIGLASVAPAGAQDSFRSSRPQGYVGQGHDENHKHYQGLKNKQNGSCCNGMDCRPTQAKWNPVTNTWEAMVDGRWQSVPNDNVILDNAWLEHIGRPRWDRQAHVCASIYANPGGNKQVYCLILPESDQ